MRSNKKKKKLSNHMVIVSLGN